MRFLLQNWWERAPRYARTALVVLVIVVRFVHGGPADAYWE
jgi:hypothetical protein